MGVSDRSHMTWEPKPRRWRKVYQGKTYTISCRELGVPETKEASYQAANTWWIARKAAIDADQPPHPHAETLSRLIRRRDWAARHGEHEERQALDAEIVRVQGLGGDVPVEKSRMFDIPLVEGPILPPAYAVSSRVWADRFRSDRVESTPQDRTIEALSRRFLELSEARVKTGELSASEHDLAFRCVGHFVDWIGPGNEPDMISPDRWEAYWKHLLQMIAAGTRSREYAKKDWRYARAFIGWLASMDKLTPPKNLHDRRYKFGDTHKPIPTFTLDEVRRMVEGATGQLKLHLYLMLNAGFYQSDISDLRHDEVDLERGYISRQRSKTRQHHGGKVPTVSYKLWPITLELLKTHLSQHPVLALTTREGKCWVEENIVGSRVKSRRDGIKSNYAHLQKRLKITLPLKVFRKTSSSMLDGHNEFARYAQFFLGQSGRSVAERHYVKPSQERFDEAVQWLGRQYGFFPSG